MNRRLVGLLTLCVVLGGLAGCVTVSDVLEPSNAGEQGHPFEGETVTVTVDGTDRERALVASALAYWETNASEHAGFSVSFRVLGPDTTPSTNGPDVSVAFVETVTACGNSSYPAGCAPRINGSASFERPATVQIQRGFSDDSTELVVQHEAGHLLGLGHGDEPQSVMKHEGELATLPQPNASDRPFPWVDSPVTVAVTNDTVDVGERDQFHDEVSYALTYLQAGADGSMLSNVTVRKVSDPDSANVTVSAASSDDCRESSGSCLSLQGADPDRDGAIETYTSGEVLLVDLDTDAVSWHTARQLLDAVGVDDIPDRLTDATYSQRRGDWHG